MDVNKELLQLMHNTAKLRLTLGRMHDEATRLQLFKAYVHARLDDAGIPRDPGGEHTKNGCRIGDRLDIVLNRLGGEPRAFASFKDGSMAELLADVELRKQKRVAGIIAAAQKK